MCMSEDGRTFIGHSHRFKLRPCQEQRSCCSVVYKNNVSYIITGKDQVLTSNPSQTDNFRN